MLKEIAQNRKARFDYEILETFMTGVVLTGSEVKSVRGGHINLKGAYIAIAGGEAWLRKANISRYKNNGDPLYDPFRDRKLLLNKREIEKIERAQNTQGITLVPLEVILQNQYVKIKMGVARGKKTVDKRKKIQERMDKRAIARALKTRR